MVGINAHISKARIMKQYIFTFLISLFSSIVCFGQYRDVTVQELANKPGKTLYEGVYRFSPPSISHCDITNPLKIDESKLHIEYDLLAVCDTTTGQQYKDKIICLIGDEWCWTYGECNWRTNMLYSLPNGHPDEKNYKRSKGYVEVFASYVYRNLKTGNIMNSSHIPEVKNQLFRYDEKTPKMNWELTGDMEEISGYACQKAVTRYAGREWTVWFTPEVPVDCGLWKFNGLPGLIMKAQDSKEEYVFSLIGIEQRQEDIVRYPKREKSTTRAQFRKAEKFAHDDPILSSDGADGYRMIISEERNLTGREVFSSGHFLFPYNPIELE